MSVDSPAELSTALYGPGVGRGDVELHVLQAIRDWIVPYIADYERQHGLAPRTILTPPTPESIHGGIDYETFDSELFPEIIVIVQPEGPVERYGDGTYGSWYTIGASAVVSVEGDQERTRGLADIYGSALQKLLPQQGSFGVGQDGTTPFATRTRLEEAYGLSFPSADVRDIVRAIVAIRTFVTGVVSDFYYPHPPPRDPYAIPLPPTTANKVEVDLIRGTPGTTGYVEADAVILDGTVVPPVTEYEEVTVDAED